MCSLKLNCGKMAKSKLINHTNFFKLLRVNVFSQLIQNVFEKQ